MVNFSPESLGGGGGRGGEGSESRGCSNLLSSERVNLEKPGEA